MRSDEDIRTLYSGSKEDQAIELLLLKLCELLVDGCIGRSHVAESELVTSVCGRARGGGGSKSVKI